MGVMKGYERRKPLFEPNQGGTTELFLEASVPGRGTEAFVFLQAAKMAASFGSARTNPQRTSEGALAQCLRPCLGTGRVSARRGWAGENRCPF